MSLIVALSLLLPAQPPTDRPTPAASPTPADIVGALESVLADAIARAEPSVIAIHRHKGTNPEETLAVRGRKRPAAPNDRDDFISFDYGSGVVIGDHGEILTAFHVVQGADRLRGCAVGGRTFEAEILAADPRSDLAVIVPAVEPGTEAPKLRPIPIGDSSRLRKGSFLIAIGNQYNAARHDGSPSASWGILSNFARKIEPEVDEDYPRSLRKPLILQNHPILLQLDARLNLGMSGGAVVDRRGELVGLTTTAASPAGFDALAGYAVPMDALGRRIVETLKQGKEVEYGLLGVGPMPPESNRVGQVRRNTPAGQGLLQMGDEIIAIDGKPIHDFHSLILAVGLFSPGDTIRLKIRRGEQVLDRKLVLAKYPVEGAIATNRPAPWRGLRVDYSSIVQSPRIGLDLEGSPLGVVVTEIEEGSPAAAAGLKKGLLILRAGDRPATSPKAFAEAVAGLDGPVPLETEMGVLTVGNGVEPDRPKPPAEHREDR